MLDLEAEPGSTGTAMASGEAGEEQSRDGAAGAEAAEGVGSAHGSSLSSRDRCSREGVPT
jgi:hypothetical protein